MLVWRLNRLAFAPGLDGEGARLAGGRWNSVGVPVIYTASSLALAALEAFVHFPPDERKKADLPRLIAVGLIVPDELVTACDITMLQRGYGILDCQIAGDKWSMGKTSLGLAVPSQVIPRENNILLNPRHPDMAQVVIEETEDFAFDDRLGM